MDINNLLTRSLGTYFSGIGTTILGKSDKYNFTYDWKPINVRTSWVDVSYNELFSIAQNVPHLNVVISRMAELFSQMNIRHVDKDGRDIPNSDILKFMRRPSVLKKQRGWLYDWYVYNAIYNNTFLFPLKGLPSAFPKYINILPSGLMKANLTGKLYRQISIEQIIESWNMLGDPNDFKPTEIIHMSQGMAMDGIIAASKITSLQLPLSNIMAALKSNNIILTERGMIGFLVTDSRDDVGKAPLSASMKKAVKETYQNKGGLDSRESHVGLFTSETKWVPMSFDVGQLKLLEGMEDSWGMVLNAYGADRDIFSSIKGATFENKAAGLRATIQMTLMPLGNNLLETLGMDVFGLEDTDGEKLLGDFNHMPIMQEDKVTEAQARLYLIQGNEILYQNNIIDADSMAEESDVEMTGTGEVPQPVPSLIPTAKGAVPANKPPQK